MNTSYIAHQPSRLGMQYFRDSEHYREKDLALWLPKLQELGFSWLILNATTERAIPEYFIQTLVEAGIEPILHFNALTFTSSLPGDIATLIEPYAKWGVKHVILFDRPNCRRFWQSESWMQSDLVERFLDIFIPIAEVVQQAGVSPVFPPLEPGGDYWDTAFLREALQGIARRDVYQLSTSLILSAYVQPGAKPISWGAGGPERWPNTIPYLKAPEQEDQCGFNIFSWYQSISQAIFDKTLPIILLETNTLSCIQTNDNETDEGGKDHDNQCLAIARLLTENFSSINASLLVESGLSDPISEDVLCFNFGPITNVPGTDKKLFAWFYPDGSPLAITDLFRQWRAKKPVQNSKKSIPAHRAPVTTLAHYVLMPECHANLLAYYLNILGSYLIKNKPVIGFSIDEALLAQKITVVGDIQQYPTGTLEKILGSGCEVEQLFRDGTHIASSLTN